MFDRIGNVNSYVKTQNMWGKFNQKRREGFTTSKGYEGSGGAQATVTMAKKMSISGTDKAGKPVNDPELSRIVSKLNSGQELSALELEYLRKNSQSLYGKAKRVAYDREQFRQRLKSCKSIEEVEALRATVTAAVAGPADGGAVAAGGGSSAEQAAQGLATMLYRALSSELRRALRSDTLTKTARREEQ